MEEKVSLSDELPPHATSTAAKLVERIKFFILRIFALND